MKEKTRKICLIGNSGSISKSNDGQVTKVRIFKKKIVDEGYDLFFVDLELIFKNPFKILHSIKKGIKECDEIILLTAERGCKILIPFINKLNKHFKKPFILPLIGINILHRYTDKLSPIDQNHFLYEQKFKNLKPKNKDIKNLKKISLIMPENEIICETIRTFFGLTNVQILNNFRSNIERTNLRAEPKKPARLLYLSRVSEKKGIFKLINAVKTINKNEIFCRLDIYGKLELGKEEENNFNNNLCKEISYKGVIDNDYVFELMNNYDILVFPTQYITEGTPGILAEGLISGIPIISSNFASSSILLSDGFNSLIFDMKSEDDLILKIKSLISNVDLYRKIAINSKKSGEDFTYEKNRSIFIRMLNYEIDC